MELARTRDVIVLAKDKSYPVKVDSAMAAGGWPGGQGAQWAPSDSDNFVVTYSNGWNAVFLLWGSNESSDQYISYVENQPTYRFATACSGTWIISTSTYEKHTLQSRLVNPLVENIYTPGTLLYFSLRGYFTPQDEWSIDGDPRAPNTYFVGSVIQPPGPENNYYLMLQTIL
jgi:hypothetical protein